MKKIAEYNMIRDDVYKDLILSYQEMLNALKFVEEIYPDVFITLSIDAYGLVRDAEDVLKELDK